MHSMTFYTFMENLKKRVLNISKSVNRSRSVSLLNADQFWAFGDAALATQNLVYPKIACHTSYFG